MARSAAGTGLEAIEAARQHRLRFDHAVDILERQPALPVADTLQPGLRTSKFEIHVHSGQLDWQPIGCERAAACGADPEMVVNTRPVEELLAWTERGAT